MKDEFLYVVIREEVANTTIHLVCDSSTLEWGSLDGMDVMVLYGWTDGCVNDGCVCGMGRVR